MTIVWDTSRTPLALIFGMQTLHTKIHDEKSLNFEIFIFEIFFSVVENLKNHEISMKTIDFHQKIATFLAKKHLA